MASINMMELMLKATKPLTDKITELRSTITDKDAEILRLRELLKEVHTGMGHILCLTDCDYEKLRALMEKLKGENL